MKTAFVILTYLYIPLIAYGQSGFESEMDYVVGNAKKGVYWALENIPSSKNKIERSIIVEDKLLAKIRITKEINGIRIESTGYLNTNEVTIVVYRSQDSLLKDGYIRKDDLELFNDED